MTKTRRAKKRDGPGDTDPQGGSPLDFEGCGSRRVDVYEWMTNPYWEGARFKYCGTRPDQFRSHTTGGGMLEPRPRREPYTGKTDTPCRVDPMQTVILDSPRLGIHKVLARTRDHGEIGAAIQEAIRLADRQWILRRLGRGDDTEDPRGSFDDGLQDGEVDLPQDYGDSPGWELDGEDG